MENSPWHHPQGSLHQVSASEEGGNDMPGGCSSRLSSDTGLGHYYGPLCDNIPLQEYIK